MLRLVSLILWAVMSASISPRSGAGVGVAYFADDEVGDGDAKAFDCYCELQVSF